MTAAEVDCVELGILLGRGQLQIKGSLALLLTDQKRLETRIKINSSVGMFLEVLKTVRPQREAA